MKTGVAARLVLAGLGCLAAFSAFQLVRTGLEYYAGRRSYTALEQYAVPGGAQSGAQGGAPGRTAQGPPQVDFDALRQIDENVVAWLYSPGTSIHYPVVQAEDNEYYLTHMFGKKKNSAGAIFLDAGCSPDFSDMHTVIYGHHMKTTPCFPPLPVIYSPDITSGTPCWRCILRTVIIQFGCSQAMWPHRKAMPGGARFPHRRSFCSGAARRPPALPLKAALCRRQASGW